MPKIRILKTMVGARESWVAGREYDVDDETAERFCAGPNAELVEGGSAKPRRRSTRTKTQKETR